MIGKEVIRKYKKGRMFLLGNKASYQSHFGIESNIKDYQYKY